MMQHTGKLALTLFLASISWLRAAEPSDAIFLERRAAVFKEIGTKPWPEPEKSEDHLQHLALLHLFQRENVAEANRMVLDYCHANPLETYVGRKVPKDLCDPLFRIYLLKDTHALLTREAREAIEGYAWNVLTEYPLGMSRATVEKAEPAHFLLPNNGMTNKWRRYYLALLIVRQSPHHGPGAMLEGDTIGNHCRAWNGFWKRFFHTFPNEGTDMDIAHPTSYARVTIGVYYDLFDYADDPEIRAQAGRFLTLFWAEVAAEFEPRTGERAGMATTRHPVHTGQSFWARRLLYCYNWHDNNEADTFLGQVPFLTSGYRPPAIVTAIARDKNRGCYLATSRRPGMTGGEGIEVTTTCYRGDVKDPRIILDKNGDSHIRRDVYYTPDYALGTLTTDPRRSYISEIILTPMMGATFATSVLDRLVVMGTGYYPVRPTCGITGKAVSIIARDPNAKLGRDRFLSDGTRIYVSNGNLWDNRKEDPSGWFFTRSGDAYAAIRPATGGYHISQNTFTFNARDVGRNVSEVVEKKGRFLELKDLWAPIVLQMGRAKDYDSFEAFQKSVKENPFTYAVGKLSYTSEAGETFEYPANSRELPKINGQPVNLNPAKTFDSPFLAMVHGTNKAVIHCAGYEDVVLDFGSPTLQPSATGEKLIPSPNNH